jgi:hypothetical protein
MGGGYPVESCEVVASSADYSDEHCGPLARLSLRAEEQIMLAPPGITPLAYRRIPKNPTRLEDRISARRLCCSDQEHPALRTEDPVKVWRLQDIRYPFGWQPLLPLAGVR